MKRNTLYRKFINPGFSVMLLLSFVMFGYSQSYLVHRYSETDGLPSAEVYDITQDHYGRIWFATRVGISCYDGTSWKNYTVSQGLPTQTFVKISLDRKGQVWALSDPAIYNELFIVFFDGSSWHRIGGLTIENVKKGDITSFLLLERGAGLEVLVGTVRHGLLIWQGSQWKSYTTKNGMLSNSINGIAALNDRCFVATAGGIVELKRDGTVDGRLNRLLDIPGGNIRGICVEYKDKYPESNLNTPRVWLYGEQWLGYFDEDSDNLVLFDTSVSFTNKEDPVILLPDYRGGLYIANRSGVYYLNYKTREVELMLTQSGLISGGAYSLFIDFERNIWIASARGVSKIASRRFANFQKTHGMLEDEVTAVVEYEPGKFVLGHNRGVSFWDGGKFTPILFYREEGTPYSFCRILDMKVDSQHNTWAVAEGVGLCRIDKQGRIKWYGKEYGLSSRIISLCIAGNDDIYVGADRGVFVRTGSRFVPMAQGKFPETVARKIYVTADNILYLASISGGIHKYQKERWKSYRAAGNSRQNNVYAICEDRQGRLWIGTLGGLFILEQGGMNKFKEKDFEIDRPVYFILEDDNHKLWFGTDNGVVRWDGSNYFRYSIAQGLIGQETNRAAGMVDSKGRVWIGTNLGVSVYNEQFDNYLSWNPQPKLRLISLEADGRKISLDQPAELSQNTHSMVFHFNAISFIDEKALQIKHKLAGSDKEWLTGRYPYDQMLRYSNLSPGRYRLHLKVSNTLGVWSEPVISPELIIPEPFYRRWWFYLLTFAIVFLMVYAVSRFFAQQRYAALLEKQVEERTALLQDTEKKYRTLFEESKDVIFVSTPKGELLDINPAGVELFGFKSKDEMLKETSTTDLYYKPEDRADFRQEIEGRGFVKDYETNLKKKEGDKIVAQITASLVRDKKGSITAYRGTIRDISDKKRLEQQLIQSQKMEAIGTLAGGIAHDFNNLLGVILGNMEMMLDDLQQGTDMYQTADQVVLAAKRASELVKQILTFSRQNEKEERRPLKISIIVKEALKLLRSSLPATIEIRQKLNIDSDNVLADIVQIHQVVMNLCANAAYAMRENGGVLEVSLESLYLDAKAVKNYNNLKPGNYLRLAISDTGHGIPAHVIKRIYEPYFTTKKTGEGTGMGLAVVHGIVQSHGGDISVYSEPGKGTTFSILLPRVESSAVSTAGPPGDIPGGSERILFVDDEVELVKAGKKMLERLGYEVDGKFHSREALEIFRAEPDRFDLLITDLTMPLMPGFKLAEEVRKIRPGLPVIFCSGFSASITDEQLEAYGKNNFVMKPIIRGELARVIRDVLDKREKS